MKEAANNAVRSNEKSNTIYCERLVFGRVSRKLGQSDHRMRRAGIIGSWELIGADQTDLTLQFPENGYKQNLPKCIEQMDGDVQCPKYYIVSSQGPGFDLFGAGGTWKYNSPEFPSELYLTQFDTLTTVLPLGNMPRAIDQNFSVVYNRIRCDKPSVAYTLMFTRK